jgi:hypothetical protein
MPAAEGVELGGLVKLMTPIWLLYRILLGSALAKMGACASVVTFHGVAGPVELSKTVGNGVGVGDGDADGDGDGFLPYMLAVVAKFRLGFAALFPEIHVVSSLLPCK